MTTRAPQNMGLTLVKTVLIFLCLLLLIPFVILIVLCPLDALAGLEGATGLAEFIATLFGDLSNSKSSGDNQNA